MYKNTYSKTDPIRSEALRKAANGRACVRCGSTHGVVMAHYTGFRQHDYGKGKGIKGHDLLGAWLCGKCHQEADTIGFGGFCEDRACEKAYRSEEFLHYVALTLVELWRAGVLRVVTKREAELLDT